MCLVARRVGKRKSNKTTNWENSRCRYGYGTKHIKKHLLVSGRNCNVSSGMNDL